MADFAGTPRSSSYISSPDVCHTGAFTFSPESGSVNPKRISTPTATFWCYSRLSAVSYCFSVWFPGKEKNRIFLFLTSRLMLFLLMCLNFFLINFESQVILKWEMVDVESGIFVLG